MKTDEIKQNLLDAGCEDTVAEDIIVQLTSGKIKEALLGMKRVRCKRMDEMHECARRVDCLDYLIRNTEKKLKIEK